MCVVSATGDAWGQSFPQRWPTVPRTPTYPISEVSREEFEALKEEIESLKELLLKAKEFDAATGQPDCEVDEKVELIKLIAKAVGVDLEDLFE